MDRGYTHKHTNNITITLIQAAEELFDNLFLGNIGVALKRAEFAMG